MKRKLNSNRKWVYTALSFLIPFLTMTVLLYVNKYSPFGTKSLLYSDMYHQYYPFFKDFRHNLLSGNSLLFNWSVGTGVDYLGLISYYLGSPLNLLSVLVPEQHLLGYFSMLMPLKLGLASMFFGIFLQKVFNKNDLSIPIFSCFYGLCSWALGYQWNIMWLDTFALLPLVMLGMIRLLRDKKVILYTVTLFLSVAINYYVGLFTCFFVLLCFFIYEICRVDTRERFVRDFFRIAIFSGIAIGMTAITTLPALAALQTTQSSVNSFPTEIRFNMNYWNQSIWGLLDSMSQVAGNMNGGFAPTMKEGLPNVYCGVFATILAALYLFNPNIRKRDKVCAAGLLFFINISFVIRQLDYIWHGFHFTNMIPYRFSFLYSFVVLYMAYAAWVNRKHFTYWHIGLAAVCGVSILFCYNNWRTEEGYLAYNGWLIFLYVAALVGIAFKAAKVNTGRKASKDKVQIQPILKGLCTFAFLCIMLGEMVLNVINFGTSFPPTEAKNYPSGKEASADVIAYMNEREKDSDFFRAEVTHSQTLNDGALNGYNGISTFTSSANVNVTRFMAKLGYAAKDTYNRYCYEEASPVANLFLNLKYMIERDGRVESNPYFDDVYSNGNVHLLENNAYLPLGFMTNSQLAELDFQANLDPFTFQNELMRYATDIEKDVWIPMDKVEIFSSASGPTISSNKYTGYSSYDNSKNTNSSHITYRFTAEEAGFVCVNIERSVSNDFSLWHSEASTYLYVKGYSLPVMASACYVQPGETIEVWLNTKAGEKGTATVTAAVLDEEIFREAYKQLAESTLDITSFSTTEMEGTVDCKQDGLLYTSIPQNGNWKAMVDGEPAETVLVGNAMMGVVLSEGTHTVKLVYENKSFTLGLIVTGVSTVALVGAAFVMYKPELFRKKKEQ